MAVGFPDLLRDVPGVLSNKRYGEESRLSIRGSGLGQSYHQRGVLLAQDGVPLPTRTVFPISRRSMPRARAISRFIRAATPCVSAARSWAAPSISSLHRQDGAIAQSSQGGRAAASVPFAARAPSRGKSAISTSYASAGGLVADGYRVHSGKSQIRGTVNAGYSFGDEQEVRLILYGADIDQEVPGTASGTSPPRLQCRKRARDWRRRRSLGTRPAGLAHYAADPLALRRQSGVGGRRLQHRHGAASSHLHRHQSEHPYAGRVRPV